MRLPSLGLLAILFCSLCCQRASAQQQKLTPPEADLVNQLNDPTAPHPLSDYVPCSFVVKDRDKFHAVFSKLGNTAIAVARVAIDSSEISPEQKNALQSQVNALTHRFGITLNNIAPLLKQQVANSTVQRFDAVKSLTPQAIDSVVANIEAAANYVRSIQAPNDIGCSESVLTYEETRDIFGKRMANTYIAIQVTIRNLNQDNEFLLHDIQVAIDTDLFFNTRDRKLARGVAEIGQAMNPRNQTMRYFEGAASGLATAAVPLGNIAFSDAAHGFTTFIPILKGIFPDFTIAQLGRLDDLGFTSGSLTYVIPKSGSHAMVAFIPEKVFRTRLVQRQPSSDTTGSTNPEGSKQQSARTSATPQYKRFRDYTTDDLRAFQNSLEILVAGAHVKEVSAVTPDAAGLNCDAPTGTSAADSVTCHLTGKNLQAVKTVRLVFKSDSTEGSAQSIRYDVNKTDTTKADVVFKAQDSATLKKGQAYAVVLITLDDATINTSATFTPGQTPDASTLNCDKPSGATVTCHLIGKNLKSLTQLKLAPSSGNAISSSKVEPDSTDDSKATVTFSATDFGGLKPEQKYNLILVSGGKEIKTSAEFSASSSAPI